MHPAGTRQANLVAVSATGSGQGRQRGRTGARTPAFGEIVDKQRNLVERSFAQLKQWRALATRYAKLAIGYRAAVVLSACISWTRYMGDMSWVLR